MKHTVVEAKYKRGQGTVRERVVRCACGEEVRASGDAALLVAWRAHRFSVPASIR